MARGVLSGLIWGGVLGLGVSGAVSVLSPAPLSPVVSDTAPGAVQTPQQPATEAATGAAVGSIDRAPQAGQTAPQTPAPNPDSATGIDPQTVALSARPETGEASDLPTPPAAGEAGAITPTDVQPVLPNPQALAPMEPQEADAISVNTEPAAPPAPVPDPVTGSFDAPAKPEPGSAPDVVAVVAADTGPAPETANSPATLPAPPVEALPETAVAASADQPEPAPESSGSATASAVSPLPADGADPDGPEPDLSPVDPPQTITAAEPDAAVAISDAPEAVAASGRPTVGTPPIDLTDRVSGVIIRRPGVNDTQALEDPAAADPASAQDDPRPVVRFAQPFDRADDKPLMSIVLIDTGNSPVAGAAGIAALRSFPYPLSFAIDSSLPDAAARMALYRAAGFEVLAMVDLPEGATPSDAETAFGVILPQLPEVIGVLEGTGVGLQGSRAVADQVTAILAQTGYGLVTQDKGLNTMPRLARKDGVPADPVFRDFDSKNQSATVIRRFLDQAAFKAGQEGAVIMLGRLRPDTISALLLWGLQDRASTVTLAPVSAVLLRDG